MTSRAVLVDWVEDALKSLGGSSSILQVAKEVYRRNAYTLTQEDNLFYTWQYDMRWAAQKLRDQGKLDNSETNADLKKGQWKLVETNAH